MSELAVVESPDQADFDQVAIDKEQLVTMMIEDQMFGVPILQVQDIVESRLITPVPLAPSAIAGVMNLRGRIVTVINLRRCLGVSENAPSNRGMGITVEYHGDLYTLLVDSIGDVRDLLRRDYEKPPATLDEKLRRLSTGVYRLPEDLLVVLDIERVLDTEILMQTPIVALKRRETSAERTAKEKAAPKKTMQSRKAETKDEPEEAASPSDAPKSGEDGNIVNFPDAGPKEAEETAGAPNGTLFERVGGDEAVEAAVDILYAKIMADPALRPYFEEADMDNLSFMMRIFLTGAFGGPGDFNRSALRDAHRPMVEEKGLGEAQFVAFTKHLQASFADLGVTASELEEVSATSQAMRDDFLNL